MRPDVVENNKNVFRLLRGGGGTILKLVNFYMTKVDARTYANNESF